MSLINEALKKAQKQRTGDSPPLTAMPGVGGEPAARIARRAKPVGFNSMLMRIGLGTGGLVVLIVAGVFLFRALKPAPEAPPSTKTAPPTTAPVAAPRAPTTATPAAGSVAANSFVLPISSPAPGAVAKAEMAEAKIETKPDTVAPVAPPPEVTPPKPVAPAPKMSPKAIAYIENLHIAGIRASTYDSKVLMNDHVYRVGDLVDPDLGIKITGITSGSLTFKDDHGAEYTRQF